MASTATWTRLRATSWQPFERTVRPIAVGEPRHDATGHDGAGGGRGAGAVGHHLGARPFRPAPGAGRGAARDAARDARGAVGPAAPVPHLEPLCVGLAEARP